jgi:Carbohydrate family 9 binding domain-like
MPLARGRALVSLSRLWIFGLIAAGGSGCAAGGCSDGGVDRGPGPTLGADPALVAQNLLPAVPAELRTRVDAAFAAPVRRAGQAGPGKTGKGAAAEAGAADPDAAISVIYLGAIVEADVDAVDAVDATAATAAGEPSVPPLPPKAPKAGPLTALIPGEPVRIRHFWRVLRPPGDHLRVFTYVRGDGASPDFMNLDDSPMRSAHPPESWRAGEIIQDAQSFVLRPDWRAPSATILVGLMRRGGHGLTDRVVVKRGAAQANAAVVVTLPVDLSKAPPPPGTVRVEKTSSPIVVDGRGDEPAWTATPWSSDFPTAEGSPEPTGLARAKLSWDEANLYALVHVEDSEVASPYTQHDDPLWKADCVELFIDADGNRQQYIELQVNPNNAQFDSYFATTRAQPGDLTFSSGMTTQVVRGGAGWDVELAIPWPAVRGMDPAMAVRLPPQPGDQLRLNVVRVDKRATAKNVTASSWNRITYADFHALDRMLTVVLIGPKEPGQPAAAAKPAEPAAPPR